MSSTEQQGFEILVAAFQDENSADQILAELKAAHQDKLANIEDVAVIRKEDDGRIHIKETDDMGGGAGAGIGALVGGAIGLLGGPVGVLAGAGLGAAVGGLAAKLHDAGIDDDRLRQIGDALAPGTSAIVAVVGKEWKDEVHAVMSKDARQVFTAGLADDIAIQLRQGGEVAYVVGKDATGATFGRIAATAGTVTAGAVAVTKEGLTAGEVVVDEAGNVIEGAVIKCDFKAHQSQVRSHGPAAVSGANYRIVLGCAHEVSSVLKSARRSPSESERPVESMARH